MPIQLGMPIRIAFACVCLHTGWPEAISKALCQRVYCLLKPASRRSQVTLHSCAVHCCQYTFLNAAASADSFLEFAGLYLPTSDIDLVVLNSGAGDVVTALRALSSKLSRAGLAKNIQVSTERL